jgi:hypothetical protein
MVIMHSCWENKYLCWFWELTMPMLLRRVTATANNVSVPASVAAAAEQGA